MIMQSIIVGDENDDSYNREIILKQKHSDPITALS